MMKGLILVLFVAKIFAAKGQEPAQGTVVLYNKFNGASNSNSAGIVRVYYNGEWGNLCNNGHFGSAGADVVCHQLGYTGALNHSTAGLENYGNDTSPALLTDVACESNYLVLLRCSYNLHPKGCYDSDDITVTCYSTRIWDSSPFSGMVRLQGGTYSNDGRVEIYCNGQWGTVCDDIGYTYNTGNTICKQLGYSGASFLISLAGNNDTLPTWLDFVYCSSSANCLASCQSCPSSPVSCFGINAGVTCEYASTGNNYNYQNTCILSNLSTVEIVGIVIGSIVLCLFCTFLVITVPVCVYRCLRQGTRQKLRCMETYDSIN